MKLAQPEWIGDFFSNTKSNYQVDFFFFVCVSVCYTVLMCMYHRAPLCFVTGVDETSQHVLKGESTMEERAPAAFSVRQMDEVY